jgi:hypothetical protein
MDSVEVLPEGATAVVAILVLTVGILASSMGLEWAGLVFAVGFAGLVPLVAVLSKDGDEAAATDDRSSDPTVRDGQSRTEALETLRDRYARGELTHEEFERKLEALMETETPESAAKRVEREREREEV